MSSKILEITLTPRGPFFFGQEIVFGGKESTDERRRSYLVHSRILPQQTTLLGMLRETLLRQHQLLLHTNSTPAEKQAAVDLVGAQGFEVNASPGPFGMIQSISPLVLEDGEGNRWQPCPVDDLAEDAGRWELEGKDQWFLRGFNPKAGLNTSFTNGKEQQSPENLFSSQSRVGVRITNRTYRQTANSSDEEGFYRQTFQRSRESAYASSIKANGHGPATSFVFRATVDHEVSLDDCVVVMGGERSTFNLKVKTLTEETPLFRPVAYRHNVALEKGFQRLVLLSDTYVDPPQIQANEGFIVGESIPFRYFSSNLNKTQNFYYLGFGKGGNRYDPAGRKQSRKFQLLKRGSIILAPRAQMASISALIDQPKAFTNIGYNAYQII
jgi:CRISPR-associated protein Cmr3